MKIKKLLPLFATAAALLACTEGSGGGRNQIQKIKFLHIWSESFKQFTKIVNDFMAENEDIQIETIVSNYNDIPTYMNNQVLSHSVPDVFFYWSRQVAGYVHSGAVLPLDQYMEGWQDQFADPEAWNIGKVGEQHYSVPFRCSGEVIVYNKTLFEDQGITEFPTTLQGFEQLLKQLRGITRNEAFAPFCLTGINGGTLPNMYTAFQNFSELITKSYLDPNWTKGIVANDDEGLTLEGRMLDKLRDWNTKGYFGQADGKSKDTSIRNFMEGNAAMLLLNNNNLYLLDDLEDIELGYAAIPSPVGLDYTYVHSDFDSFSISSETRYPEACVKFLKYLTSHSVQQYFSNETDSVMSNKDVTYSNDVTTAIKTAMKDCGRAVFIQNDAEYSTSNIDASNNEIILNYILGKGSYTTGKAAATKIWQNYQSAMSDAGITPVARQTPRESGDFSWLDILTD